MVSMFGLPESALGWVVFVAIASSGFCMTALGTLIIFDKGQAVGADHAIITHSFVVTLLIAIAVVASWSAAFAVWLF